MVQKTFKRLSKSALGLTGAGVTFGLGSQILSQPAFGAVGAQGAAALGVGASFLPTISTIVVGGETIRLVRGLDGKMRKIRMKKQKRGFY